MRNKLRTLSELSCLRDTPRTSKSILTKETLNIRSESRRARLEWRTGQYRELKREAVRAVRRDKKAQVNGVCEAMESHLWSTYSRPAYRGIQTLRSSRAPPCCSTVKAADGTALTGESEIRARWARYFEELYRVNPPVVSFPGMLTLSGMQTPCKL